MKIEEKLVRNRILVNMSKLTVKIEQLHGRSPSIRPIFLTAILLSIVRKSSEITSYAKWIRIAQIFEFEGRRKTYIRRD